MSTIKSVKDILKWNKDKKDYRYLYRGISSSDYKLIPKISREPESNEVCSIITAKKRYDKLKQYLSIRLPAYGFDFHHLDPKSRLWKELFIAQHYGAPTPLLDFSRNPLVGVFFACSSNDGKDGCLYAIGVKEQVKEYDNKFKPNDPSYNIATYQLISQGKDGLCPDSITSHKFIVPPHFEPRIRVQESVFCAFPTSKLIEPLDKQIAEQYEGGFVLEGMNHIKKWTIKSEDKINLLNELNMIGVNYSTLFPDISGFGEFISWKLLHDSFYKS